MANIIVYNGTDGNLRICYPSGEIPIEEVLIKDCPENAIIVDDSIIPQGDDAKYCDAWELVDGKVVVNEAKKQAIIDAIQAPITAKASALAKLTALGLSEDEVKALVG